MVTLHGRRLKYFVYSPPASSESEDFRSQRWRSPQGSPGLAPGLPSPARVEAPAASSRGKGARLTFISNTCGGHRAPRQPGISEPNGWLPFGPRGQGLQMRRGVLRWTNAGFVAGPFPGGGGGGPLQLRALAGAEPVLLTVRLHCKESQPGSGAAAAAGP